MQSLTWYFRRLRAMSPGEVAWRMKSVARNGADRLLVARRRKVRPLSAVLGSNLASDAHGFATTDVPVGAWSGAQAGEQERSWLQTLVARADAIAAGKLTYFDLVDQSLGEPIDWNRDHKAGVAAPMQYSPSIDYRDFDVTGDCKFVWEPGRHHQFVVLARAYRATGDERHARAVVDQLGGWLDQCPYGVGMHWRMGLELGIRLINWAWALDMIRPAGLVAGDFRARLLDSVWRHVWETARKYARGSSANNHLVGEAAGVFVATCYWPDLRGADHWRQQSRQILREQILAQTYDDGGDREQAIGYHLFVLQFFLVAGLAGRNSGQDMPPEYWRRLEDMFDFLGALSEGGQDLPMFGDADDGYVLDLGDAPRDVREWLAVAAGLFDRGDFKAQAGAFSQTAYWLGGPKARADFERIESPAKRPLRSRALADTGYYLLQAGQDDNRISVVFDCGPLGMGSLAGHGHADALSFTLRAAGRDVLVDPGTYDYFTYPAYRQHFRGTRAHNTAAVDGQNQSVMQGLFLWGRRANARVLAWDDDPDAPAVTGEHDGYTRLSNPVTHRRTLKLDTDPKRLTIEDELVCAGVHEVAIFFHASEHCRVERTGPATFLIATGPVTATLRLDDRLTAEVLCGSDEPIGGWVSRGYHRKSPATTLIGRCGINGNTTLTCTVDVQ